jgi:hypothetical protein
MFYQKSEPFFLQFISISMEFPAFPGPLGRNPAKRLSKKSEKQKPQRSLSFLLKTQSHIYQYINISVLCVYFMFFVVKSSF